jgi:6-bladed beta-propeller
MRAGKETSFILGLLILAWPCCKNDRWKGKIYKEDGVTVVENGGAGLWDRESSGKIEFIEELSLGVEAGVDHLMFSRLTDIEVDADLNIYVLDGGSRRLLKFDQNGRIVWQAGRKGQGPGEFQYPDRVALANDGKLAVWDGRLQYFDDQGMFLKSLSIGKSLRMMTFLPDRRLFVNIMLMGQPGIAAEYYSSEGEFLERFSDEYRYGPQMSPNLGASIDGGYFQRLGDKICLSLPDRYEIREYDVDGRLLRRIKRDVKLKRPNINVSLDGRGVSVGPSDSSGPCHLYKDEYIINCLTLVEKIGETKYRSENFLDFFNEKGQYLGSRALPEARTLEAIDSEGRFYFLQQEPFPRVIRSTLKRG